LRFGVFFNVSVLGVVGVVGDVGVVGPGCFPRVFCHKVARRVDCSFETRVAPLRGGDESSTVRLPSG